MTIVFCRRLFESRVLRGDQRIHRAFVEEVIRQCRMDLPECSATISPGVQPRLCSAITVVTEIGVPFMYGEPPR